MTKGSSRCGQSSSKLLLCPLIIFQSHLRSVNTNSGHIPSVTPDCTLAYLPTMTDSSFSLSVELFTVADSVAPIQVIDNDNAFEDEPLLESGGRQLAVSSAFQRFAIEFCPYDFD